MQRSSSGKEKPQKIKLEKLQRINHNGGQMVGLDSASGVTAGNDSSAQKTDVKEKHNREL